MTGLDLIRDVDNCRLSPGQCALWWMGQHSYILKMGDAVVYIDPFLTPIAGRQVPPMLQPEQITNASLVLGTHDHLDHIDRATWPAIAKASPATKFVVPALLLPGLANDLGMNLDRFIGLDDGMRTRQGGVQVAAIPAAHEFLDRDLATGRYPYLGYIVTGNGCCVYHAGDTCLYDGMASRLKAWRLDMAILPINGRDARRLAANCIGNMTYQEAGDLAAAVRPALTIPSHYDMFIHNSEDPRLFLDYLAVKYPSLRAVLCSYGVNLTYSNNRPNNQV